MLTSEILKFKEKTNKDPIFIDSESFFGINLYQYVKQNESFDKDDATRVREDTFELKKYKNFSF